MMRNRDMIKLFCTLARKFEKDAQEESRMALAYGFEKNYERSEHEGREDAYRNAANELWDAIKEAQK